MKKITMKIDGMKCGMCETHVNNCVRTNFDVKSVKSSHLKNETEIVAENDISEADLKNIIERTGYKVLSVRSEDYKKKGFLGLFKK